MGSPCALLNSVLGGPGHGGSVVGPCSTKTFGVKGTVAIARKNDKVTCTVHGDNKIATASTHRFDLDGKAIARINDTTDCGAIILTGDDNLIIGD